jgi:pentatricopeptide repeat protein
MLGRARASYGPLLQTSRTLLHSTPGASQLICRLFTPTWPRLGAVTAPAHGDNHKGHPRLSPPAPDTAPSTQPHRQSSQKDRGHGSKRKKDIVEENHHLPPELLSILAHPAPHNPWSEARAKALIILHLPSSNHIRRCAEQLAASHHPLRASRLLALAHQAGISLKQNVYECVAYQLAQAQRWRLIPPLTVLGKQQSGRTTARLLNWTVRAHIQTSHYSQLDRVFDCFSHEGIPVSRRTFHLLISGHLRNHDVEAARRYLQKMEESGHPVDSSTHALVMTVYRGLGPDKEVERRALEALQDIGGRSATYTLNSLMQACLDADNLPGALHILGMFNAKTGSHEAVPTPSNVPSEGTVSSTGSGSPATGSSKIVVPDSTTYTMLLNYMAGIADFPRAMQVVEQAHHTGFIVDTGFIAALVRVHFATQRAPSALAIVARICQDSVPYAVFVDLGASSSPRHLPIPSWTSLCPDIHVLNELAEGLLRLRGLNGFLATLRIMRACEIRPDDRTLDILLSHLRRVQRTRPRDLLRVIRALRYVRQRPTMKHYHEILSAIVHEEQLLVKPRGWQILSEGPSQISSNAPASRRGNRISQISERFHPGGGFKLSTRLSYRRLVRPIVESLQSRGLRADRATVALRIKHDAVVKGDIQSARSVFASMVAAGMHPNEYHFCALMEGYTSSGDMAAAVEVMNSARTAGIKPNVVMFTVLISGYARKGEPEKAFQTFQDMLECGLRPDHAAVDALCSAYYAVKAFDVARRLLIRLWPHVADMPNMNHHDMTLNELRTAFRATEAQRSFRVVSTRPQGLSKSHRRLLRWKLRRLVDIWTNPCHSWRKRRQQTVEDASGSSA